MPVIKNISLKFLPITFSILTIYLVIYSSAALFIHSSQLTPSFGQDDFREYWSAGRLFLSHLNPYNAQEMFNIQSSIGYATPPPLMMWTPPWTLILLYPVLLFPFQLSATIWVILSIGFVIAIANIGDKLTNNTGRTSLLYYLTCFTFFPLIHCLLIGQISLLLGLTVAILIYSLKSKKYPLSGFSLFLLTIKPHLFLLVVIAILSWCLQNKTIRPIIWAIVFTMMFAGLSELLCAGILENWLLTLVTPTTDPLLVSVDKWETRNLCYVINTILGNLGITAGNITQIVLPLLAILGLFAYLKTNKEITIERLSIITALSSLCAPFGWVFDNSILLVFYCYYLSATIKSNPPWAEKINLIAIILAPQLLSLLLATTTGGAFASENPVILVTLFSLFPAFSLASFYIISQKQNTPATLV